MARVHSCTSPNVKHICVLHVDALDFAAITCLTSLSAFVHICVSPYLYRRVTTTSRHENKFTKYLWTKCKKLVNGFEV